MRILLAEDDEATALVVGNHLTQQGYVVDVVGDGETAWDLLESAGYELVILDVMLPELDGITLCRRLRTRALSVPVLLLTARDTAQDKVAGLDAGADDYLVKPVELGELAARLRALLRRKKEALLPVLAVGALRLDSNAHEVTYAARDVVLTRKEYGLLELFMRNPQRLYSRSDILAQLWPFEEAPEEETVKAHVKGLRQKLKAAGAPEMIETVYGTGYRLRVQVPEPIQPAVPFAASEERRQRVLAALAETWERHKPRVHERLAVLDEAGRSVLEKTLGGALRLRAEGEAHKLVGYLGTFGLLEASRLAREIEQMLGSGLRLLSPEQAARFAALLVGLHGELESIHPSLDGPGHPYPQPPRPLPTPERGPKSTLQEALHLSEAVEVSGAFPAGGSQALFDDLVNLAAQLCAVPTAFIGLLEAGALRLVAKVGSLPTHLPGDIAFWGDRLNLGENGSYTDVREALCVLGLEPQFHFLSAFPFSGAGATGTIGVLDFEPRVLTSAQTEALAALARQAAVLLGCARSMTEDQEYLDTLKQRDVAERTAELTTANSRLQLELAERQRAEEALERLSHQNELILNSAGDGIVGLDLQGRVTFVNPTGATALGYRVEELLGHSFHKVVHGKQAGNPAYALADFPVYAALLDGQAHTAVGALFTRKNGVVFPVEFVNTHILEKGQTVGAVLTFQDVTERQLIQRMKDEFISVVSHELRTPLTSICGALGMLASGTLGELPQKGRRMLDIALHNTDRLVRLINDILDIERIISGKVTLHRQFCDTADLMRQSLEVMRPMAEQAGVSFSGGCPSLRVWADPDRLVQTITNLLSNAIKFSPPGAAVKIAVDRVGEQIRFQVSDEGRGIPADKLESIFERFSQVDASDSRNRGGTGLGLAICRGIVQQHGGRIWAQSEPGRGSTFSLLIPSQVETPGLSGEPATAVPGRPLSSAEDVLAEGADVG